MFLEILIILTLSIFQSIFGIGLLLFGTPFFLFLDYSFISTLSLLLPTSISISLFQFLLSKDLDYKFAGEVNLFCIPFLMIFLFLTILYEELINFKYWVSLLLIFSSLIMINKNKFLKLSNKVFKFRKGVLAFIGIIHGVTNMGGSFLSIFSSSMSGDNKLVTRQYIAYGYLSMGIIQYLILIFFYNSSLSFDKIFYVIIAMLVYFPSQKAFKFIIYDIYIKIIGFVAIFFGFFMFASYYF